MKMNSGVSKVELLILFFVVGLCVSVSIPFLDAQMDRKKSDQCLSNLQEMGRGLEKYVIEHDQQLPDLMAGRHDSSQDVPVLETVLVDYVPSPEVFWCPADFNGSYERSGSSYYWNYFPRLNEEGTKQLKVSQYRFTTDFERGKDAIELITDKDPNHKQRTTKNSLYLYGEITF
ncbi:MAG: hypothetical protein AAFY98_07905 [Verrucomicrobiota bacterium]